MKLTPLNRHLLVAPLSTEENKTNSGVLLPEDYQKEAPDYIPVKLVATAHDVDTKLIHQKNRTLIVQASMVEKVSALGNEYFLVKENYVVGVLDQ